MDLSSHLGISKPGVVAVSAKSVTRQFPGVLALDAVNFEVKTGEVHSLVGENGAGKSTLIRMITGAERPDVGSVTIFGHDKGNADTSTRLADGVSAMYQELMIVSGRSAAANVFLKNPPKFGLFVSRQRMHQAFNELAERLSLKIRPDALAGRLSIADQQMIEIMRALVTKCRVLIMDEPTATLGPEERNRLYEVVRDLRDRGCAIVYISHDLDEVLKISDRISVMRNGSLIQTRDRGEWTKDGLVRSMVGQVPAPAVKRESAGPGRLVLKVRDLVVPGRIDNVSLDLHAGEILGIAGLVGSGRTELLRALAGADSHARGQLELDGQLGGLPINVRDAIRKGIVLVPEDRRGQGLVTLLSGWRNSILTDLYRPSSSGFVNEKAAKELAAVTVQALGLAPKRLDEPVRNLSGGNQQKVVIGKWLHRGPRILLLDEPTRGIDVGAKAEIYAAMRRLTDNGLAVILVSSELQEVVEQSDRVLCLGRGRILSSFTHENATVGRLLSTIFAVADAT
jgi:ABC-type sugar transport system ATPase subunit